jgi:hypothetical protein
MVVSSWVLMTMLLAANWLFVCWSSEVVDCDVSADIHFLERVVYPQQLLKSSNSVRDRGFSI